MFQLHSGVGNVMTNELDMIASMPSEDYRFSVDNLQALDRIKDQLSTNVCKSKSTILLVIWMDIDPTSNVPRCQQYSNLSMEHEYVDKVEYIC